MNTTFERVSPKLVKVVRDGAFAGWLEQRARRTDGFHSRRIVFWSGLINKAEVSATTLTSAKAKACVA